MAIAIIQGIEHEVRTQLLLPNNYGVSVLGLDLVPRSTVNLAQRKPSRLRYKLHADNAEAALRQALSLMKAAGEIEDYTLAPGEEAPPPVEKKPKPKPKPVAKVAPAAPATAAAPADKPAADKPAADKPAAAAPADRPSAETAPDPAPSPDPVDPSDA